MSQLNFDVTNIAPSAGNDVVPAGWYPVLITAEQNKQTKANTGEYCEVEFTIADGPHASRKVWNRFNLWNTDSDTVARAQSDMAALCQALGVAITDTSQLLNQRCEIKVTVRKSEEYGDQNNVKGYRPIQSIAAGMPPAAPSAPGTQLPGTPAPAAAPTQPAPWAK